MSTATIDSTARNTATVGAIYEAFGRGDVPAILALIADDCAWENWADNSAQKAGVPWMQAGTGPSGVGAFFQAISAWQPNRFEVLGLMTGGDKVVAEVEADFTVGNGKRFAEQELHLWTLNAEGKVTAFRHYLDTAKHIEVSR